MFVFVVVVVVVVFVVVGMGQDAFFGLGKHPFSNRQWLLRPVLKKLVLESNEEVLFFCFLFIVVIFTLEIIKDE